jgi:hypothetical protein
VSIDDILGWLSKNKEWVFSGAGVFTIATLGSIIRSVISSRRRRPAEFDKNARQATGQPASRSTDPKSTARIPLMTQTLTLLLDNQGDSPPLTMGDGTRARAAVNLAWRVINPYLFIYSSTGHPFDVLMPLFLSRIRQSMEVLTLDAARTRRRESEDLLSKELQPDFEKRGIKIESIVIGVLEKLSEGS